MDTMRFYSTIYGTTYLELWGGSSKHPDLVFALTKKERAQETCYQNRWTIVYKFLLKCASKMLWAQTAWKITELANAMYRQCMEADNGFDFLPESDWE